MPQTKATKKFEKRHLKDTLERRKGLKKVKQKQQIKQRRKDRRSEENGDSQTDQPARKSSDKAKDAFNEMSVDEFFQGGFEVPTDSAKTTKKRRRVEAEQEDTDSDDSLQHEPVLAGDQSEDDSGDESVDHKEQLDALAENDPEFHKYLQENEPELLDGDLGEPADFSDEEAEEPRRKRQKTGESEDEDDAPSTNDLGVAQIQKWSKALKDQKSLRATREVVLALRAAAYGAEDEERTFKYSLSDPEAYHQLLTTALRDIPDVLQHHLPVQETKSGKLRISTEGKKFKILAPLLKSLVSSITQLLENLSDAATLRLTLSSALPLIPYLLSFKKILHDLIRAVTNAWSLSSNTEATRIAAFLVLRRLMVIGDPSIRENVLKAAYQGLVRSSRNTTIHTLAGMNLMKNSGAELWGIDTSVGYSTGFTFIRQLAIHLRGSITNNSNESYKTVYNWQYIHSLDFWSRVLAAHCIAQDSPLRPLIYPLVQVTLGALRLIPTATYFPLRFQLIRSLLRLSMATGTYIPLAAPLLEVLNTTEMRKAPKPSTLKPLDFATSIRAAKSYLHTRVYQDGIGEQTHELLTEFFNLWSKSIAFPELALPVIIMLKRWVKQAGSRTPGTGNKNQKLNGMISLLVQKLEANSKFIEEKRTKVSFAPNNRKEVQAFLQDLDAVKTPLGAFAAGLRRQREEKAKLVEQARLEQDKAGTKNGRQSRVEDEEDQEEDDEEEEEEISVDGEEDSED